MKQILYNIDFYSLKGRILIVKCLLFFLNTKATDGYSKV